LVAIFNERVCIFYHTPKLVIDVIVSMVFASNEG